MVHEGKLVEIGKPLEGCTRVFYAHGSYSLRTYLGKSKFHSNPGCRALLAGNAAKSIVAEWTADVPNSGCCRICGRTSTLPMTKPVHLSDLK